MAVNFSISIPSHLVPWLSECAKERDLYTSDGRPSVNKAAAKILEEDYERSKGGKK